MRVLAVIPARGGSKGIPRKNLAPLGGRPLIAWTIEAALTSRRLARVIVSTEDEEIAAVSRRFGAEVPFLRAPELARDDAPTLPVIQDAMRRVEEDGSRFDAACILQPTSPMRGAPVIDGCIDLLESSGADAVITVLPVPHEYNPHWTYLADADGALRISTGESDPIPRRQQLPPAFHREGSVYLVRRRVLMEENSLYGSRLVGYPMDAERSVNIDEPADLVSAARMVMAGSIR